MRKLTQDEAGNLFGITASTLSRYEAGKREPDLDTLCNMARYYQVSVNDLLGMAGPTRKDLHAMGAETHRYSPEVKLPIYGEVCAGGPMLALEDPEGMAVVDPDLVRDDVTSYFWLRVRGDSMTRAGIMPGGRVLVHRQPTIENRQIGVVCIRNSSHQWEATIKRMRILEEDKKIILIPESYNPDHEEQIYNLDEVVIVGRVKSSTAMH